MSTEYFRNPLPSTDYMDQSWPPLTPLSSNSSECFHYLNITGGATLQNKDEAVALVIKQGYLTERMNFMDSLNLFESVHQEPLEVS